MAQTVQCGVPGCGERVASPPPDACPKCGTPFDPEMVAHQRAVAEGREREYLRERRARLLAGESPASAVAGEDTTPPAGQEQQGESDAPAEEAAPKRRPVSRRKTAASDEDGDEPGDEPGEDGPGE